MSKTYKIVIGLLIISMLAIPIIINEAYKVNNGYQTLWEPKDMLSYFGTIIGVIATIFAVTMTIKHNEKQIKEEREYKEEQIKEERKLSIRPYLSIYNRRCAVNEFVQEGENDIFIEIEFNSAPIVSYDSPGKAFLLDMDLKFNKDPERDSLIDDIMKRYLFINFYISNVGAGNAIEFIIEHNENNIISNIAIGVNQTKVIKYFFDLSRMRKKDIYSINIKYKYKDVASLGTYYQKERINFRRDKEGKLEYYQIDDEFLTKPVEM